MDIEMEMTFSREMKIVLAKYSLDGAWLGFERMTTQVRDSKLSALERLFLSMFSSSPPTRMVSGPSVEQHASIHAETSQILLYGVPGRLPNASLCFVFRTLDAARG